MLVSVFTAEERVLLVGEGNFSFTVDLVDLIQLNVTATCIESEVISHTAERNIQKLQEKGVRVYMGVDGTKLAEHPVIGHERFDKVVFNFPHVGGKMKLGLNRTLLRQFLCSATELLGMGGRVVVSLCRGQGGTPADKPPRAWSDTWQAVEMAAHADLLLDDVHAFQRHLFPHYSCVGYRGRDTSFQLDGALVHVFRPAGPLFPLTPQPSPILGGSPMHYLCRQLEAFLEQRVKVQHIDGVPSSLHQVLSLWSGEDSEVMMTERLLVHPTQADFSSSPTSMQVVVVGAHTPGLCTNFVTHLVTLFRKHEFCSVSCDVGTHLLFLGEQIKLAEVKAKSDTYLFGEYGNYYRYLVCEEYCVGSNGRSMQVNIFHVDKLAEVMFDVVNWRELWADGASVQVRDLVPYLKRASLYSRAHVLDVTFRETDTFTEEDFYEALWQLAGDVVTGLELLNKYQSPEGWRSRCYRLTYQSFSRALCRNKAIMIHQHVVGEGLATKLGVTIF